MNAVILTTAQEHDIHKIQAIANEVWPVAYAQIISAQQISYMLEMMYSSASLHNQMMVEGHQFILAHIGDECVGFAGYSKDNNTTHKLHKLYVLTTMHGKGVGKLLLEEVAKRSQSKGAIELILQVNKNNKAKDFYMANGFEIDHELVLDIGNGFVMDDFVLKRKL